MTKSKTNEKVWGDWALSYSTYELSYKKGFYCVDLEDCCDSAQVLDWIQHLAGKTFAHEDPRCIFDLVCALKDLLEIPKGYCEQGITQSEDVDVKSRINGFAGRRERLERFLETINTGRKPQPTDAS